MGRGREPGTPSIGLPIVRVLQSAITRGVSAPIKVRQPLVVARKVVNCSEAPCMRVPLTLSLCAGRALARALEAKQAQEQEAKIRFAATRAASGSGADPLQGVQLKDLGRPPTALEQEIYKHMAEVAADPTVFTAYMPPVERSHPSVHPAYRAKKSKRSKGVSWMYAISVRFFVI